MDSLLDDPLVLESFHPQQPTMRLAVVTETWPPEVNGVALTLSKLVQGLCARHHSVQLIRPRQSRHEAPEPMQGLEQMLSRGLPIPHYPQLKLGLPNKGGLVKAWRLQRPDLVHIATEGPLGWSALQAARFLKIPSTSDFRTNFHSYSQHYGAAWLSKPIMGYLRKFHNHTQLTMVPTRALRQDLMGKGFHNLHVVGRGVDTALFNPARRSEALRQSWQAGPQTLVLLSAGRLAKEKNLDVTLDSFLALKAQGHDVRLVLAGDGPYRSALQARCPEAIFMGMCSHAQLAEMYASADLFVFPSLTETFGNVTLEALASGTPVMAFDCAAAAEHVAHARNGWLVPGAQAADFIRAAQALPPATEIKALRETARSSVLAMDWGNITHQVEKHFSAVIGQTHAN